MQGFLAEPATVHRCLLSKTNELQYCLLLSHTACINGLCPRTIALIEFNDKLHNNIASSAFIRNSNTIMASISTSDDHSTSPPPPYLDVENQQNRRHSNATGYSLSPGGLRSFIRLNWNIITDDKITLFMGIVIVFSVCFTGVIGLLGSNHPRTLCRNGLAEAFNGILPAFITTIPALLLSLFIALGAEQKGGKGSQRTIRSCFDTNRRRAGIIIMLWAITMLWAPYTVQLRSWNAIDCATLLGEGGEIGW